MFLNGGYLLGRFLTWSGKGATYFPRCQLNMEEQHDTDKIESYEQVCRYRTNRCTGTERTSVPIPNEHLFTPRVQAIDDSFPPDTVLSCVLFPTTSFFCHICLHFSAPCVFQLPVFLCPRVPCERLFWFPESMAYPAPLSPSNVMFNRFVLSYNVSPPINSGHHILRIVLAHLMLKTTTGNNLLRQKLSRDQDRTTDHCMYINDKTQSKEMPS